MEISHRAETESLLGSRPEGELLCSVLELSPRITFWLVQESTTWHLCLNLTPVASLLEG